MLAERYGERRASVFLFGVTGEMEETYEVQGDVDREIRKILKSIGDDIHRKLQVLEKLEILAKDAALIFVIRHRELTRGGEYIELAYLATAVESNKMWLMKREGVPLSTMVLEFLDSLGINMRTYSTQRELIAEAVRILRYRIKEVT